MITAHKYRKRHIYQPALSDQMLEKWITALLKNDYIIDEVEDVTNN